MNSPEEIKQLFNQFNNFIGKSQCIDENYCKGEIRYDTDDCRLVKLSKEEIGNYEERVQEFLSRKYESDSQYSNHLLLIGPIGSGKSTAVSNQINRTNKKRNKKICTISNEIIVIDFNLVNSISSYSKSDNELFIKQHNESINLISENIMFYEDTYLPHDILTSFIPWLSLRRGVSQKCPFLARFLTKCRGEINALVSGSNPDHPNVIELNKAYKNLIEEMSSEEHCIFLAYKQRWIWELMRESKCSCKCLVADNIDHLHPNVQKDIVELLRYISDIIHTKILVTVRPVTISRAMAANYLIERLDHCAPRIESALINKITWFIRENSLTKTQNNILIDLKNTLSRGQSKRVENISDSNLLCQLLVGTSGMSIRFAIRHIHNYLESKQAITACQNGNSPFQIKPSDLANGYFCSSGRSIMEQCYARLDTSLNGKGWNSFLIKPRILDYLSRGSTKTMRKAKALIDFLTGFGYEVEHIIDSLNDLMSTSRPLIWCKSGFKIEATTMYSKLEITPIGLGYIDHLFGEFSYEEVLLQTNQREHIHAHDVRNSHHNLTDQSLREVRNFLSIRGVSLFRQVYSDEDDGIILRHWNNLLPGLKHRLKRNFQAIDEQRSNFIKSKILNEVQDWKVHI